MVKKKSQPDARRKVGAIWLARTVSGLLSYEEQPITLPAGVIRAPEPTGSAPHHPEHGGTKVSGYGTPTDLSDSLYNKQASERARFLWTHAGLGRSGKEGVWAQWFP